MNAPKTEAALRVEAMGCPECMGEVETYDQAEDGRSGRYVCKNCGRDTIWAALKAYTIHEVMNRMMGERK